LGWGRGEPDTLNGDGVSNLLEVLQLPKFPHFECEGGDGGPAVDSLTPTCMSCISTPLVRVAAASPLTRDDGESCSSPLLYTRCTAL
jgi:hypothetical protein